MSNKQLLHVGCGPIGSTPFAKPGWAEIRLDADPNVKPDIEASITEIPMVANSVDGVFGSHVLEHLYSHEVAVALKEFYRVLRPDGKVIVTVPDIKAVATAVASGDLDTVLYVSPSGPIAAIDVLWGLRSCVASGNVFYQHKTGFTKESLERQLIEAGFTIISVVPGGVYQLTAVAVKEKKYTVVPYGIAAKAPT